MEFKETTKKILSAEVEIVGNPYHPDNGMTYSEARPWTKELRYWGAMTEEHTWSITYNPEIGYTASYKHLKHWTGVVGDNVSKTIFLNDRKPYGTYYKAETACRHMYKQLKTEKK